MTSKVHPWLPYRCRYSLRRYWHLYLQEAEVQEVAWGAHMCHGAQQWLPVYCCWVRIWAGAREGARVWLVDSLWRGSASASPPLSPSLTRCCRNDCSHGLGCLLRSGSGINMLAGNCFLFLLLKTLPSAQPSCLSFVLALEVGRAFGVTVLQARGSLVECG